MFGGGRGAALPTGPGARTVCSTRFTPYRTAPYLSSPSRIGSRRLAHVYGALPRLILCSAPTSAAGSSGVACTPMRIGLRFVAHALFGAFGTAPRLLSLREVAFWLAAASVSIAVAHGGGAVDGLGAVMLASVSCASPCACSATPHASRTDAGGGGLNAGLNTRAMWSLCTSFVKNTNVDKCVHNKGNVQA